jgi:hypothetical protein
VPSEKDILAGNAAGKAKILLMGASKSGKSVAAVSSSPGPVFVINAEPGGLASVAGLGAKFSYEEVWDWESWQSVYKELKKDVEASKPKYRTVVLDSITRLGWLFQVECEKKFSGYDTWRNFMARLIDGCIENVLALPCHVVAIAHVDPGMKGDGSLGILPAISGQGATHIPAMFQDTVWLETTAPQKESDETKREFLCGPQGSWKHSGRSIRGSSRINADITAFMKKFGIKP